MHNACAASPAARAASPAAARAQISTWLLILAALVAVILAVTALDTWTRHARYRAIERHYGLEKSKMKRKEDVMEHASESIYMLIGAGGPPSSRTWSVKLLFIAWASEWPRARPRGSGGARPRVRAPGEEGRSWPGVGSGWGPLEWAWQANEAQLVRWQAAGGVDTWNARRTR